VEKLSKITGKKDLITIFLFIIFFFNSTSLQTRGYYFSTDLQVGESLIYKRHDYNFTSQTWSPWSYLMYEISSIQDTQLELEETIVKAVQWVSNDTIHWKQTPFIGSTFELIQDKDLSETGTISRLQEVPIHRFSGFKDENFVIRSDVKIGDIISAIRTNINASLDEEDWLILEPINDGFGLKITVSECGCSVEGGTNRRVRNITYSTRGILDNYYFSERVDYGPDAVTGQQEFELTLLNDFEFDGVVFENLSSNWKELYDSSSLNSNVIPFYGVSVVFSFISILLWKRRR
jgi:hypothetical protein